MVLIKICRLDCSGCFYRAHDERICEKMTFKKKLIEVAIPLEAINKASAREKSIRHGHPSTLHLWWARRPLAACRAVLFAQLVDDPSSHPDKFPTEEAVEAERKRLFAIIEELVKWENLTKEEVLERARAEIHKSCGDELPPIYDPFSGGCSIPLEAQRLGLPAYGSDLNPVAVMIGKAMIEIPSKFKDMEPVHPGQKEHQFYRNAEGLAEDVKYYGEWMREKAWERIGYLYPEVDLPEEHGGGKATVIAWIWARTVPSPDPAFSDVQVPLVSSFLLSSKKDKKAWVEPIVDKTAKTIKYRIRYGGTKGDLEAAKLGTTAGKRQAFLCVMSGAAIPYDHIREAGKAGQIGQKLIAIVAEGKRGRVYVGPHQSHENTAFSAEPKSRPETHLPNNPRDFKTPNYGMKTFGDLFTGRQLVALNTFSDLVHEAREQIEKDAQAASLPSDSTPLREGGKGAQAYAEAVSTYLALLVSQLANHSSSICGWNSPNQQIRSTFSRQAIPMTWDFAEVNLFSGSSGSLHSLFGRMMKGFKTLGMADAPAKIIQFEAQRAPVEAEHVLATDPPYYDNIGYADLSDFFYVWMKKSLGNTYPDLFGLLNTPKSDELVATPYRHGGAATAEEFFMSGMRDAISNVANISTHDFPATIFYAFKQSEVEAEGVSSPGWVTFVQSIFDAGYSITGTWPLRTEKPGRMLAVGTNALANSVVLVCRKIEPEAGTITRAEFVRILKKELAPAIADLQAANISPADMPQSAIGPGIGVFSRYKTILEADDSPMTVKTALQLINKQLDEFLNDLHGEFDADTRFAVTWFEQHGIGNGDYGSADNLARAKGISVESVKEAGIVYSAAGKVRIRGRDEIDNEWDPVTDKHLTIWECCQHLIRALRSEGGEPAAAMLLKKIGSDKAGAAKDLAYYLYDVCSNKLQDAKEATAYNDLITVWGELTLKADTIQEADSDTQETFDI